MAVKVFQTQVSDPKEWAGLTTRAHLGWLGMEHPQFLTDAIDAIYKYGVSGEDFVAYAKRFPAITVANDTTPFRWMLSGATEKNVPLLGASTTLADAQSGTYASGTAQLGLNQSSFWLVFAERYFSYPETITGARPFAFSVRIMSEPTPIGPNKWAYEVKLWGATYGENFFVPLEDVAAGTRWSAEYAAVSQTLSRRGSEPKYASYFTLENWPSMIRKQMICAGNMLNAGSASDPLLFKFVKEDGTTESMWIDYQMWKFIQSFRADQARIMLFGRSTVSDDGTVNIKDGDSGYAIKAGRGLYEQISPSTTIKYTDFSIRQLESIMMELSYNKKSMDDRKFLIMTGERGAMQFYKAMKNEAAAVPYLMNQQQLNFDGAGMGTFKVGSINKYVWYNGIEVSVVVDPTKDNGVRNSVLHPDGGFMSSYEYDIIDAGSTDGNPNIQRIEVSNMKEMFGYIPGLRNPYMPGAPQNTNPNIMATPVDGYEVHGAWWGGLNVRRPDKIARLVPAFLY